jgi:hypothetical protein
LEGTTKRIEVVQEGCAKNKWKCDLLGVAMKPLERRVQALDKEK